MSVKKYLYSYEFRQGMIERLSGRAIDLSRMTGAFEAGYLFCSQKVMSLYFDECNKFLESIGEEKIEMVEAMRHEKEG